MAVSLLSVVRTVARMPVGESFVLREPHLPKSTVHRYKDAWIVLFDRASDRHPVGRAFIGFSFPCAPLMADLILGAIPPYELSKYNLVGEAMSL
jgi:hypothetical protein